MSLCSGAAQLVGFAYLQSQYIFMWLRSLRLWEADPIFPYPSIPLSRNIKVPQVVPGWLG